MIYINTSILNSNELISKSEAIKEIKRFIDYLDEDMILTGEPSVDWKSAYKISKNARYRGTLPYEFLYGYAITTHRAQGSEFPKVLIIEEKFPFDEEEHARWLYTAVTRGSKKVVLVR